MNINKLYKIYALNIVFLTLLLCACSTRNDADVTVLVKAKCVYNSGDEARFESNTYHYSEIVILKDVKEYVVGKYYYLEFRKK